MDESVVDERQGPVSLGFGQYLRVLQRQWRLVCACALLGVLVAAGYLVLTPRSSIATTTLNINVITTEPFSSQRPASGLLDGPTEADIARSHVVAEQAAKILDEDLTPTEIRASSEVETTQGASVVKVVFTAATRALAIDGANAVASAYLRFRSEQAEKRVDTIVDSLSEQIDELNTSLVEANDTIANTSPTSNEHVQALTQQQQILTELDGLLANRNALHSVDTTGGTVLSAAQDNPVYAVPGRTAPLLTGLAAGLVLGIVAAFVRNPFDRRLRSAHELSRLLGAVELTGPSRRFGEVADEADELGLRVAKERLLSALAAGDALVVLDSTNGGEPSPTTLRLAVLFEPHGIEVLAPRADDPAAVIAALRSAAGAVVVFDTGSLRSDEAVWIRREAEASGTALLGIIERPAAPRDTASAPETTS